MADINISCNIDNNVDLEDHTKFSSDNLSTDLVIFRHLIFEIIHTHINKNSNYEKRKSQCVRPS